MFQMSSNWFQIVVGEAPERSGAGAKDTNRPRKTHQESYTPRQGVR